MGEFLGVGDRADELPADSSPVFEGSPVEHLKPSDTDSAACGGDLELPELLPAWVSGNPRESMELIDHKAQVVFRVIRSIAHDGPNSEVEMLKKPFEQGNKEGGILEVGGFRHFP